MFSRIKILIAVILGLFLSTPVYAAVGTVTQALTQVCESGTMNCVKVLTFTGIGGTAGETGTWPATAMSAGYTSALKGWYLYKVITTPGATPPEDNWDFTLVDTDGIDVLGSAGLNRHTTTSQMLAPLLTTGVYFAQPVLSAWTFTPSGNTTASAIIVVKLIFVR